MCRSTCSKPARSKRSNHLAMPLQLLRTVIWRNLKIPGQEYCMLFGSPEGFNFNGWVILAYGRPYWIRYEIQCDSSWNTRSVQVAFASGNSRSEAHYKVKPPGLWWRQNREIPELRGCLDVDLGFSPATNTLPIRRLNLRQNESGHLAAAWIRLPDQPVVPLEQIYTNLGGRNFRYQSVPSGFTADITVDHLGLVAKYSKGWIREAAI